MARFNPPPDWPAPPAGFVPLPGWRPDPSWPPPPPGWQLIIDDAPAHSEGRAAATSEDLLLLRQRKAQLVSDVLDAEALLVARRREIRETESVLSTLRQRADAARTAVARRVPPAMKRRVTATAPVAGYAVLDLETTGLSAQHERIIEVAVVHVAADGTLGREWSTLIHPGRPSVGATRVHGITAADVRDAPPFVDAAAALIELLEGRVVVAHNAKFDLPFLRAEMARAGVGMPTVPTVCTLEESWRHLPGLQRRRLADCCDATGVDLTGAHSALGDARAAAGLLACYLRVGGPELHAALLRSAATTAWPRAVAPVAAFVPRPRRERDPAPVPAAPGRLAAQLEALPLDAPELPLPEAAGYLEVLAAAIADGVLTDDEVDALVRAATDAGLRRDQVIAAHRGVLLALAEAAVEDGVVSTAERAQLLATAAALGLPASEVAAVLDEANFARSAGLRATLAPLPAAWDLGQPLRLGDAVVFTGGDEAERARLERRCRERGLRVTSSVSRKTVLLVTDDVSSGTGKARRALELGTRVVDLRTASTLLDHVQPDLGPVAVDARPGRTPVR